MIFWNGNKSPARQRHERDVLEAILAATVGEFGPAQVTEDTTNYPSAEDEGNIFNKGVDLLVTVAGNAKFSGRDKIIINRPIARGLLGNRLLVIRENSLEEFAAIRTTDGLKKKSVGIPSTWADAALFRANGYPVVERGSFEDVFSRLKEGEFEYVSLGANEIEEAFETMARPIGGLVIEPNLMLHYPFYLLFYIHPERLDLARRVESGLQVIEDDGTLDRIFETHYGLIVSRLGLDQRRVFSLANPLLPEALSIREPG